MKTEWKKYVSVTHLDNLETLKAQFFKHSFGRHFHAGYAIGIILQGSETYQCNQRNHVAPRGSIVVVNPGEIHNGHASDCDKGWGYFMIYPHLSLVKKALADMEQNADNLPVFSKTVIFDDLLAHKISALMVALESNDSKLALETRFLELLNVLIKHHARFKDPIHSRSCENTKIKKVMHTIQDQFCTSLSLETLAREVDMSPYALLRRFKKETGLSPYLLQTWLKLNKAKQHLARNEPLADIAAACGFSDQSHMTKQFKKWMGITPGDYSSKALKW